VTTTEMGIPSGEHLDLQGIVSILNEFTRSSPWSNNYLPPSTSGPTPSPKLRQLETSLNAAFDTYREMYFEGGVSSVYLWDLEDEGTGKETSFAGVVLMKKSESSFVDLVEWNSFDSRWVRSDRNVGFPPCLRVP
jgi:hypothetical protein